MKRWLAAVLCLLSGPLAAAEPLRIAVASNFVDAMDALIEAWERSSGESAVRVTASTGKLYAQIVHGAPFDLFFSADVERPRRLEAEGRSLADTRFTYALGRLVLWSPDEDLVDARGQVLQSDDFRYLAIANPRLAPYGRAARQLLETLGLWTSLQPKLVRGENIGQTYHFVASGNAELGLVAWSQIGRTGQPVEGSWWLPPAGYHAAVEQQAVQLTQHPQAAAFLSFVRGSAGRQIIRQQGYDLP